MKLHNAVTLRGVRRAPAVPEPLPEDREGFKFRSGSLPLDLAATLAARRSPEPRELLATPPDLDRWLRAARRWSVRAAGAADLNAARALREAVYGLALACIRGGAFPAEERSLVNACAARPLPESQLGPAPGKAARTPELEVQQALTAIAREAVALLSGRDAARIRNCAGCTILFVDASRAGRRRWCSMAACGNRRKVAAHRRRNAEG